MAAAEKKDTTNTQAQQKVTLEELLPGVETFKKLAQENVQRLENGMKEMEKVESFISEQTQKSIQRGAELSQDALQTSMRLASEWRALSLDMTRRFTSTQH